MNNSLTLAALLLGLGSSAFAQAAASSLSRIGAAAAVSGAVKAVAPNASVGRVIESGKPLYLNDHVTTDAAGHLQVLLLDETVFTLGANADMVLDDFVYNPKDASNNKVSAQISKGAFRFVTGKVARANPEKMKVKLAVGTIGVRGTVVEGETGKGGSTVLNVGEGPNNNTDDRPSAITVSNAGVSRLVDLTGQGVKVLPGQAPSFPHDMADEIQRISALLAAPTSNKAGKDQSSGSAGENSGQLTAAMKDLVIDSELVADNQQSAQSQTTIATQFTVPNGITTWDYIRANVPSGQGYYFSGEGGPITCGGGGCASSNVKGSLQLQIDFAARTIGGSGGIFNPTSGASGSFIHIHGVTQSNNSDTIQQTIGLSGGTNPIPFSSLTGPATITLSGTNLGSVTTTNVAGAGTGNFNGSTISLANAGGVVAAQAVTHMTFSGLNASSSSVNASGTFNAPKY